MENVCTKMSGAERAKYYKEQKKLRRRKQKLDCYNCNSEKYNQAKKTNRQINGKNTERSKAAVYKQKQRSDLKLKREGQRQYKQLYRNRKRQEVDDQHNAVNMNRMTKSRAIKKLKNALPSTPVKRVVVLKQYMSSNSPTARTVIKHNGSDCSVPKYQRIY